MKKSILKDFDTQKTGFFRFKKFKDKYLITNDLGNFHFLKEKELEQFVSGRLNKNTTLYKRLKSTNFVRDYTDFNSMISEWQIKNQFLWRGPGLHIIIATLRCDHNCVYCQTSSSGKVSKDLDMSLETARKTVERIFESPNKNLSIEFQGGEPLLNFPVIKEVVKVARKLSKKTGKSALINVVTNLTTMTDKRLKFCLDNNINICTSLDGPEHIHNKNRVYTKGNSYQNTLKWFKKVNDGTKGKRFRIDAVLTTTKAALSYPKEIVDEYEKLGARGIFLRHVVPIGTASKVWNKIGYTPEEFLKFYESALDYIVNINIKKRYFFELTAVIFLTKILSDVDFNFVDMRSPCGAGIGQIAYNHDGNVFTCDEARMLYAMGDKSFLMGNVYKHNYGELINAGAVKCLVTSSCAEAQAMCSSCVYKPYCGVCPVFNYVHDNDLYGRMPTNLRCKIYEGVLDIIFKKIQIPKYAEVFRNWVKKVETRKNPFSSPCK